MLATYENLKTKIKSYKFYSNPFLLKKNKIIGSITYLYFVILNNFILILIIIMKCKINVNFFVNNIKILLIDNSKKNWVF